MVIVSPVLRRQSLPLAPPPALRDGILPGAVRAAGALSLTGCGFAEVAAIGAAGILGFGAAVLAYRSYTRSRFFLTQNLDQTLEGLQHRSQVLVAGFGSGRWMASDWPELLRGWSTAEQILILMMVLQELPQKRKADFERETCMRVRELAAQLSESVRPVDDRQILLLGYGLLKLLFTWPRELLELERTLLGLLRHEQLLFLYERFRRQLVVSRQTSAERVDLIRSLASLLTAFPGGKREALADDLVSVIRMRLMLPQILKPLGEIIQQMSEQGRFALATDLVRRSPNGLPSFFPPPIPREAVLRQPADGLFNLTFFCLSEENRIRIFSRISEKLDEASPEVRERALKVVASMAPFIPEEALLARADRMLSFLERGQPPTIIIAALKSLGTIIPRLAAGERLRFIGPIEGLASHPEVKIREAVIVTLGQVVPSLEPGERLPRVEVIERFYGDPLVGRSKGDHLNIPEVVRALLPNLSPEEVLERAGPLLSVLRNRHLFFDAHDLLKELLPRLEPALRVLLVREIECRYDDLNPEWRRLAIAMTANLVPLLAPADREARVERLETLYGDPDGGVRQKAFEMVGLLVAQLPPEARLKRVLRVEEFYGKEEQEEALAYVERYLPHLAPADLLDRARRLLPFIERIQQNSLLWQPLPLDPEEGDDNADMGVEPIFDMPLMENDFSFGEGSVRDLFKKILGHLRKRDVMKLAEEVLQLPGLVPVLIRGEIKEVLKLIRPYLSLEQRMELVAQLIHPDPDSQELNVLRLLLHRLSPEMFSAFARSRGGDHLERLAVFYSAHLPMEAFFWQRYHHAPDRERFLSAASERVSSFRRGAPLARFEEEDLQFAFAGLDAPEFLSFDRFSRRLPRVPLPPPFLTCGFGTGVREIVSYHSRIDKGKVIEAAQPLRDAGGEADFRSYLMRETHGGKFRKIRREVEAAFPRWTASLRKEAGGKDQTQPDFNEFLEGSRKLLADLWKKWDDKGKIPPPVIDLIVRLAFFLAWQGEAARPLRGRIADAASGTLPSETLFDTLKALEEFYRDTVEDVLKAAGILGDQVPFLRRQRRLLRAEIGRVQGEVGDEVPVEFVPSKSQTDYFFGWVGEDCTTNRAKSIRRDDFQVIRMVSRERLVGMIYLQKAVLDQKRVVVMAIQPRSSWDVDHRHLLEVIETRLGPIVGEEGYEALLLMDHLGQQSNRQDMLQAIVTRAFDSKTFHKSISGTVFEGNQFLVVWERKKR